jgi:hypothetical protein
MDIDRAKLREKLGGSFDLEELRTLCFDLNIDYQNLPSTREGLAREMVAYCENRDRLPELIEASRRKRPDIPWTDVLELAEPPSRIRYYIASSAPEAEMAERFKISGENFERIVKYNPETGADFIIFDLSNPPQDWLKYVGGPLPLLSDIVFVAFEGVTELGGKNILDVVTSSYKYPASHLAICRNQNDLSRALEAIEYKVAEAMQKMTTQKMTTQVTLASVRQRGGLQ